MMKIKRQYMIPFTYDHAPEEYGFIRVNTTDMKEIKQLAQCIFGSETTVTVAYEDVEVEE
jgi:hypothetical protein